MGRRKRLLEGGAEKVAVADVNRCHREPVHTLVWRSVPRGFPSRGGLRERIATSPSVMTAPRNDSCFRFCVPPISAAKKKAKHPVGAAWRAEGIRPCGVQPQFRDGDLPPENTPQPRSVRRRAGKKRTRNKTKGM